MNESDLMVRPAQHDDLQKVATLCAQWRQEGVTRGYRNDSRDELAARLGPCFLVAECSGDLIGFMIGEIRSKTDNELVEGVLDDQPEYLEVQDLYVSPLHRRNGVGEALMKDLLARAAKLGAPQSLVYSANRDYLRTAH